MGNPGPTDTHPLHGELPNAHYQQAALVAGSDTECPFMALTGLYRHTLAFKHNYSAEPMVKLHANSSQVQLELTVAPETHTPMELMYLAHINFGPVDDAVLIDTADWEAYGKATQALANDVEHTKLRGKFAESARMEDRTILVGYDV
jgi:hypothetical protein